MFARVATAGIAVRRAAAARRLRRHLGRRPAERGGRCCSTSRPTASTPASTWRRRAATTTQRASRWVRAPSASTDALRLLQGGRADMAILDIHDLGLARQEGADIVGVMALVQRPLASVLAQPDVRRPRDLEGARAGVTGLPSDVAVLRSVVAGDDGDPDRVRTVRRLRSGESAARRPHRRRDGVLERRGRCARAAPRHARVPRRRLRCTCVSRARAVREPPHARGETA